MKNVTKILTAVVLCAAIFASTQRTDALGGNPAFWPGDEANISAFPAQINNHGFLQVTNMNLGTANVDMVFSSGSNNWSLGYSNSAHDWFSLGWGNNNGMGINIGLVQSDNAANTTSNGFKISFGKDLGDNGEIGFHYVGGKDEAPVAEVGTAASSDYAAQVGTAQVGTAQVGTFESCSDGVSADQGTCEAAMTCGAGSDEACVWTASSGDYAAASGDYAAASGDYAAQIGTAASSDWVAAHVGSTDWNTADQHNGMTLNYRKSCGFWVFTDMVASLAMPDDQNAGEMMLDIDMFGHMDAGAADVMFAMGIAYNANGGTLAQTADIGVEAAVTDNVTVRGGMNWSYDLSNDAGTTGATASGYGWNTGAGVNFGSFTADLTLGETFYSNPFGFLSGNDDDTAWGNITATYSF